MTTSPSDHVCSSCKGRFAYRDGFKYRGQFVCTACGKKTGRGRIWPLAVSALAVALLAAAAQFAGVFAAPGGTQQAQAPSPPVVAGLRPRANTTLTLDAPVAVDGRIGSAARTVRLRGTAPSGVLLVECGGSSQQATVDASGRFDVEVAVGAEPGGRVALRSGTAPPLEFELVLDTTAPELVIVHPDRQPLRTQDTTVDLIVQMREANPVRLAVGDRAFVRSSDDRWVLAFLPLEAQGETTFTIHAVDLAGNRSEAMVRCMRDMTGPILGSASPPPGSELPVGRAVAIDFTFDEELLSASLAGQKLTVEGHRARGTVDWPATRGTWETVLVARDRLGNTTQQKLDYAVPETSLVLTAPIPVDGRILSRLPTVRLTGTAPGSLRIERAGTVREIAVDAAGRFDVEVPAIPTTGEAIVLRSDRAPAPISFTLALDAIPPAIELVQPQLDPVHTTQENIEFVVRVQEANLGSIAIGDRNFVPAADGSWTLTQPLAGDGESLFVIVATDLAGNHTESTVRCVRDTAGPALGAAAPEQGSELPSDLDVSFAFHFDEELQNASLAGLSLTVQGTLAAGKIRRPLRQGAWEPVLEVRDLAGNVTRRTLSYRLSAPKPTAITVAGTWREQWGERQDAYHEIYRVSTGGNGVRVEVVHQRDATKGTIEDTNLDGHRITFSQRTAKWVLRYELRLANDGRSMVGTATNPKDTVVVRWDRVDSADQPGIGVESPGSLMGIWQDPTTGIRHAIELEGGTPTVSSVLDSDGAPYEVRANSWNGRALTWTYRVPSSGYVVRLETQRLDGNSLWCAWTGTMGIGAQPLSGTQQLRRSSTSTETRRSPNQPARATPSHGVAKQNYKNFDCTIVYTPSRTEAATRASRILSDAGFDVKMSQISRIGAALYRGNVFSLPADRSVAEEIVTLLAMVEPLRAEDGRRHWSNFGWKEVRVGLIE